MSNNVLRFTHTTYVSQSNGSSGNTLNGNGVSAIEHIRTQYLSLDDFAYEASRLTGTENEGWRQAASDYESLTGGWKRSFNLAIQRQVRNNAQPDPLRLPNGTIKFVGNFLMVVFIPTLIETYRKMERKG